MNKKEDEKEIANRKPGMCNKHSYEHPSCHPGCVHSIKFSTVSNICHHKRPTIYPLISQLSQTPYISLIPIYKHRHTTEISCAENTNEPLIAEKSTILDAKGITTDKNVISSESVTISPQYPSIREIASVTSQDGISKKNDTSTKKQKLFMPIAGSFSETRKSSLIPIRITNLNFTNYKNKTVPKLLFKSESQNHSLENLDTAALNGVNSDIVEPPHTPKHNVSTTQTNRIEPTYGTTVDPLHIGTTVDPLHIGTTFDPLHIETETLKKRRKKMKKNKKQGEKRGDKKERMLFKVFIALCLSRFAEFYHENVLICFACFIQILILAFVYTVPGTEDDSYDSYL